MSVAYARSVRSIEQNRNVSIWSGKTHEISMGFHVDDMRPITFATVYRWFQAANETLFMGYGGYRSSFRIFPAVIEPIDVYRYIVRVAGDAVPWDSQEPIAPGDYGLFAEDGSRPKQQFGYSVMGSFAFSKAARDKVFGPNISFDRPSDSLTKDLIARDGHCCITGATDELTASWIFAPHMGPRLISQLPDEPVPPFGKPCVYIVDRSALEHTEVIQNGLTLTKEIAGSFWDNQIGVDVDDDYRIHHFKSSATPPADDLPRILPRLLISGQESPNLRPSDTFLRLHFQRCISVNMVGGGIEEDISNTEIDDAIEELGVNDGEIDYRNEKWETPLGKEIKAWISRSSGEDSAEEEDSDYCDND